MSFKFSLKNTTIVLRFVWLHCSGGVLLVLRWYSVGNLVCCAGVLGNVQLLRHCSAGAPCSGVPGFIVCHLNVTSYFITAAPEVGKNDSKSSCSGKVLRKRELGFFLIWMRVCMCLCLFTVKACAFWNLDGIRKTARSVSLGIDSPLTNRNPAIKGPDTPISEQPSNTSLFLVMLFEWFNRAKISQN